MNEWVVGSRGRYLGPGYQRDTVCRGYTKETEDALLEKIDWRKSGYRLFEISVFDEYSGPHWYNPISESNSLFMPRGLWRELGGYCERFASPGGGYLNLDTWRRACLLPGALPVVLLGEATFHQLHGGVATNVAKEQVEPMREEYMRIRGEAYTVPPVRLRFFGAFVQRPPLGELGLTRQEKAAFEAGMAAGAPLMK